MMDGVDSRRIRVVIADDHTLVRRGTRELLEQSGWIEVVAEATDGAQAIEEVERHRPDVAVLDVGMPEVNGVEAARAIALLYPSVRVLMLTVHDDVEYVWQAIKSGASGYLMKHASESELVDAVRGVAEGRSVLDPAVTKPLLDRIRQEAAGGREPPVSLTDREIEMLELVARGLSNHDISERLDRSSRTVETHLRNAFKKLGVHSRTEGVVLALRLGIIKLEEDH